MKHTGRITWNNVAVSRREYATIKTLASYGETIELLVKSNKYKTRTPDVLMDGLPWEIKCLNGTGKYVISNLCKRALRQSENIIIDLRWSKIPQEKCVHDLERIFRSEKRIKRLIIIEKGEKLLTFNRTSGKIEL